MRLRGLRILARIIVRHHLASLARKGRDSTKTDDVLLKPHAGPGPVIGGGIDES